jgi:hypothetical protein
MPVDFAVTIGQFQELDDVDVPKGRFGRRTRLSELSGDFWRIQHRALK